MATIRSMLTAVHPESYAVVEQIAQSLNVPVEQLIEQPALLEKLDRSGLAAGVYTLNDILEELRKPGRDPRERFVAPAFKESVREIGDLQPGMTLEGVVTNVTKFGAFVDVGVHQDGLVHVSELADRYIKEPSDLVKVGQLVKVHVLSADAKTKRIALSMKTPGAKGAKPAAGVREEARDASQANDDARQTGGACGPVEAAVVVPTAPAARKTTPAAPRA